jgi:hypothetical protein
MSSKDFVPFEEPPKKKEEQQLYQSPRGMSSKEIALRGMRRQEPPIRYTPEMLKNWGPPSAESRAVEAAWHQDPSLKVSFNFDPKTGMVGLKRTDPVQVAA